MQSPVSDERIRRKVSESVLRSAGSSSSVKFTLSVLFHGVEQQAVICIAYEGASSLHRMPAAKGKLESGELLDSSSRGATATGHNDLMNEIWRKEWRHLCGRDVTV